MGVPKVKGTFVVAIVDAEGRICVPRFRGRKVQIMLFNEEAGEKK